MSYQNWENFDAECLFPPPQLHVNHLTKIDRKNITKVDPSDLSEMETSEKNTSENFGDTYSDVSLDENHVDKMFEMEGQDSGKVDDREIKADKENDERSKKLNEEPKKQNSDDSIQKKSEEIEEVAEATSKTSEDIHGGDEATKDIEDSPNAADEGQNDENQGAEIGDGDKNERNSQTENSQDSEKNSSDDAHDGNEGNPSDQNINDLPVESWETKADQSTVSLKLLDDLYEIERKTRDEKGHRTTLPSYDFNRESSPIELEIAFRKASELLKKFAAEEDSTSHQEGVEKWDVKKLVKSVISYRHHRIPSNKYERPKEADICILLDISGSCSQQAEMFMAIAAGCIGNGVKVFVGYNGSCRKIAMNPPNKIIKSYIQAKPWAQDEVTRVAGWNNANIGEWDFDEFLKNTQPKTLIIFGDWDGRDQYSKAINSPKLRLTKFFWFANEGSNEIPSGFSNKNYISSVFTPRDFVRALKKLK